MWSPGIGTNGLENNRFLVFSVLTLRSESSDCVECRDGSALEWEKPSPVGLPGLHPSLLVRGQLGLKVERQTI